MDKNKNYIPVIDLEANIVFPLPGIEKPLPDGKAAVGTSARWAREDHVHPISASGDIPEKLSELENDMGFITQDYVDKAVEEKANIYYLPAIVKLSEVQVGDDLSGKTLIFDTTQTVQFDYPYEQIKSANYLLGENGGPWGGAHYCLANRVITGTSKPIAIFMNYNPNGSNSWLMSEYVLPDDFGVIESIAVSSNNAFLSTSYDNGNNKIDPEYNYNHFAKSVKNLKDNIVDLKTDIQSDLADLEADVQSDLAALEAGISKTISSKADIYFKPINLVNLSEVQVGDDLSGKTLVFDTTKKVTFNSPYELLTSTNYIVGQRSGMWGAPSYNLTKRTGATSIIAMFIDYKNVETSSWLMSEYKLPDDFGKVESIVTGSNGVIAATSYNDDYIYVDPRYNYKLIQEVLETDAENVKLNADNTQVINSDIAIKNGKKILLEKKDGAQANGISVGDYTVKTFTTVDIVFPVGKVISGSDKITFDTSKNPIIANDASITTDTSGASPVFAQALNFNSADNTIILKTSSPTSSQIIVFDGTNWLKDSVSFSRLSSYTTVRTNTVNQSTFSNESKLTFNNFGTLSESIIEQIEVGTESDPLCLNHSATSITGEVVGKNIIVNYKDENGETVTDSVAYSSDLQELKKQIEELKSLLNTQQ